MIWLIGAGYMAKEYAKVLKALDVHFTVIGRNEENCKIIAKEYNCSYISGGIENYLATNPAKPEKAIVAVGIEALSNTTALLLEYGIKDILLEKPGIGYPSEIHKLTTLAKKSEANVLLAYNRRFYSSVIKAQEIIEADGGVTSFAFEFTEWSHTIKTLNKTQEEWHNWFLGNSTHVIDMAFFLGGEPRELSAYHKGSLSWHPASANFCGAGISSKEALFSYHANWEAPGRWVLEVMTAQSRLIFKPLETLQIQKLGSVAVNQVEIEDRLDKEFKPGLYLQTKAFVAGDNERFCNIYQQERMIETFYKKMANY